MKQPPGFMDSQHPSYLRKLDKSFYGLKQAPNYYSWILYLQRLMSLFFIFNKMVIQMYILIYVHDIIIINSSSMATEELLTQLRDDFAVKDLEILSYFLEIEVCHTFNGLVLTQHKYIQNLLSRTNMLTSKGVSTPMLPSEKLLLDGGEKL